jgi:2-methylaconitate cis-trans-isomerase PrpF
MNHFCHECLPNKHAIIAAYNLAYMLVWDASEISTFADPAGMVRIWKAVRREDIRMQVHSAIGVFAAVTVATAAVLPGSPAHRVARLPEGRSKTLSVEHPTGEFSVRIEVGGTPQQPVVERAGLLRTARVLFDGVTYVKRSVFEKSGAALRAVAAE